MPARSADIPKLEKLRSLADSPREQVLYALDLLRRERSLQVVLAALHVLEQRATPEAHEALIELFEQYTATPRRDPGCLTRASIVRALQRIARKEDVGLFERAAVTYEFLPPGRSEEAGPLRAAALMALHEVEPTICSFHCVRILVDGYTSELTGEPAATAMKLLAAQGHLLPLYQRVMQPTPGISEVVAESLRHLVDLPASLLAGVVEQHGATEDEIVLIGLFDLLLHHAGGAAFSDFLVERLRGTRSVNVYRYAVTAIVASRKARFLELLPLLAGEEPDVRKRRSLLEALELARGQPAMDALREELAAATR